jgi:peptidylprolyl isomerase
MRRTLLTAAAALTAAAIGACGGTSSSGGPIELAPSAGAKGSSAPVAAKPTSTTPASTTSTPTPKTGPISKPPVIHSPGGTPPKTLQIKDLVKGTGPVVGKTSSIVVNYVGALYSNSKVFSSSWTTHTTFPATLGPNSTVIKGWNQGIPGMRVGGRRELIIPPSLAYGDRKVPGIPANSTLIFVIDVVALR